MYKYKGIKINYKDKSSLSKYKNYDELIEKNCSVEFFPAVVLNN